MRYHSLLVACVVAWSWCGTGSAAESEDVRGQLQRYAQARAALLQATPRERPAATDALQERLLEIARIDAPESRRLLEREARGPESTIASAAVLALLRTKNPESIELAARILSRSGTWPLPARVRVLDGLAEAGERGIACLVELVERGDPETRALALGSLARCRGSDEARRAILGQLRHPSPQVRNAALRALASFRHKSLVAPLIDLIEGERDAKLRLDALKLLVGLTGYNMGFVSADWRKWWELAERDFQVGKPEEGATSVVPHDLTYFGIEVTSKRIAFLVDASNSMLAVPGEKGMKREKPAGKERKIDLLKEELSRIVRALPEDAQINIVAFAKGFWSWKPQLHPLVGSGRSDALRFVESLACQWGTNIYDTLESALADRSMDTIYLLSDGRPVGGKLSRPEDIIREIGAINRIRGATIHCIGFGPDTAFLETLASENGGEYRATFRRDPPAKKKQQQKKRKGQ